MSSIIKSGWREIIGLLILNIVLVALPFIFFGSELKHYSGVWYVTLLKWLFIVLTALFTLLVILNREDPDYNWQRPVALGCAAIFCIILCCFGAGYRSDKSDNIQFDKPTAYHLQRFDQVTRQWVYEDTIIYVYER